MPQTQIPNDIRDFLKSVQLSLETISQNVIQLNLAVQANNKQSPHALTQVHSENESTVNPNMNSEHSIVLAHDCARTAVPETPRPLAEHQTKTQSETGSIRVHGSDGNNLINTWRYGEKIRACRNILAKHKRACENMKTEFGCFISHMSIVGGNRAFIERAEQLRDQLLGHVHSLEMAVEAFLVEESCDFVNIMTAPYEKLRDCILAFMFEEGNSKLYMKLFFWKECLQNTYLMNADLDNGNAIVETLQRIHDGLLSDLEMEMDSVIDELLRVEYESLVEWLSRKKRDDFESQCRKHVDEVLRHLCGTVFMPEAHKLACFKDRLAEYWIECKNMHEEFVFDICLLSIIVAGAPDRPLPQCGRRRDGYQICKVTSNGIIGSTEISSPTTNCRDRWLFALRSALISFGKVCFLVNNFQGSLYHQKHAFYFHDVKQWAAHLWTGLLKIFEFLHRRKEADCFEYMYCKLLPDLGSGVKVKSRGQHALHDRSPRADIKDVCNELRTFREESLPGFLADEKERATTRYVNITAIATFFSSVTATTLQFTYQANSGLGGVVNLFWFISLVLSVSSGVTSLLNMTWRGSFLFYSHTPPRPIHLWLNVAPMILLAISAISFLVGLNLFTFQSMQPHYVSITTYVLTALQGIGILSLPAWIVYRMKHGSFWARWARMLLKPLAKAVAWLLKSIIRRAKKFSTWILRLYLGYRHNLNIRRNIYWAFGFDHIVACINGCIDWEIDWPQPYRLSKLIRFFVYPIKKYSLWALSALERSVPKFVRRPVSQDQAPEELEAGETELKEFGPKTRAESVKEAYLLSLRAVFGEELLVGIIMDRIAVLEAGGTADYIEDQYFERWLWGYPKLLRQFHRSVRPAISPVRLHNAEERGRGRASDGDNNPVCPPAMLEEVEKVARAGLSQRNHDISDPHDIGPETAALPPSVVGQEGNATQMDNTAPFHDAY